MKRCLAGSILYLISIPCLLLALLVTFAAKSAIHEILAAVCWLAFIVALAGGSIVSYLHGILWTMRQSPVAPIATDTRTPESTFRCPDCNTEAPQSQFTPFPDNRVRCPHCMSLLAL